MKNRLLAAAAVLSLPLLVANASAQNDPIRPHSMYEPPAAADASASSSTESSTDFVTGPLAYSSPVPMAHPPVTAAVEALFADGMLSESAVSIGATSGRAISEEALSEGATSEGEVATVGGAVSAAVVSAEARRIRKVPRRSLPTCAESR